MSPSCGGCDRELRDGYLCRKCERELDAVLDELPWLIDQLTTTAYRQDRIAALSGGRGNGERPLPFRARAAALLADVRVHLLAFGGPEPTDVAVCKVLRDRLPHHARNWPEAPRMFAVLIDDAARIRDLIDLPKSFRYLGCCDSCGTELYADRSAEAWVCKTPDCDASYDVKARMSELIERARDVVAPTSTIATALTSLEYPVTEELIRKWASRGLLTARTAAGRQRWYRLGDVLDLALRHRANVGVAKKRRATR